MFCDKKNLLNELCNNYNKEFVEYVKKAEEQTDFTKIRVYLTKGNDLKRKAEDNESELSKIEKTLSTLSEKGRKLEEKLLTLNRDFNFLFHFGLHGYIQSFW